MEVSKREVDPENLPGWTYMDEWGACMGEMEGSDMQLVDQMRSLANDVVESRSAGLLTESELIEAWSRWFQTARLFADNRFRNSEAIDEMKKLMLQVAIGQTMGGKLPALTEALNDELGKTTAVLDERQKALNPAASPTPNNDGSDTGSTDAGEQPQYATGKTGRSNHLARAKAWAKKHRLETAIGAAALVVLAMMLKRKK